MLNLSVENFYLKCTCCHYKFCYMKTLFVKGYVLYNTSLLVKDSVVRVDARLLT